MMTLAARDDGLTAFMVTVLVLGALLLAGLVFAAIEFRRHMRELAVKSQRCPHCSYDLHGTQHECCPECGRVATQLRVDHAESAR